MSGFVAIEEAIRLVKAGQPIILVDDPKRENQGDLFVAAERATLKHVNLMIQHAKGLVCLPLTDSFAAPLDLRLMVEPGKNSEATSVNFMVSIDAKSVEDFGISSADRLKTIKVTVDRQAQASDLVQPGHLFPLLARRGGILERAGHTEAACELAQLAGLKPVGVICEVLNEQGKPARLEQLEAFSKEHQAALVSVADLVNYRKDHPQVLDSASSIRLVSSAKLPTSYGEFKIQVYESIYDGHEHSALIFGNAKGSEPVLTRIHSKCLTGDTFSSMRCDCNAQLHKSLELIAKAGRGILVYLDQEGRGIGLSNKIKAYAQQDQGYDTVEANLRLGLPVDDRDYGIAADILKGLGVSSVNLLTNNPLKEKGLKELGVKVQQTVPLETTPNGVNDSYLKTKKGKLKHRLSKV